MMAVAGFTHTQVDQIAPELDHIRYVCMVDDRRAREELLYTPGTSIEDTVRSVELESW